MTSAIRASYGLTEEGSKQLTQLNEQAFARLGYDPDTVAAEARARPSPEQLQRAAQAFFAHIKKVIPT